ncbi:hypothetical protein KC571_00065 [candidate division WWE3 bacterium]|uniref:Uncharacterized protein n=1 Tax=candidate division WWE3 bacterium TaxID=2053526 RepID=A0A955LHB0_UNCKA|nr:hypothetical protein [candidate division WWE3 bacterium]
MKPIFKFQTNLFVRNLEAGNLWENFFISAIFSLLSLRTMLKLTGYPQIGSGQFHVAHMLFGGLFMVAALILAFLFLNKEAKQLASVLGGLGFGAFIDELGKFITSDNNYFFEPAIAFIYITFVIIFLIIRASEKYIDISEKDYAVNALEIFKDVITSDLDETEKKRALAFLNKSGNDIAVVKALKTALKKAEAQKRKETYLVEEIKIILSNLYIQIVQNKMFSKAIISFFVLSSLYSFTQSLINFRSVESFFDLGQLVSSTFSGVIVLIGTYALRRGSRLVAFEIYKYAVLVNIFLTQFFVFYHEQLSAIIELVLAVTVYIALRYLISQEELIDKTSFKSPWQRVREFLF